MNDDNLSLRMCLQKKNREIPIFYPIVLYLNDLTPHPLSIFSNSFYLCFRRNLETFLIRVYIPTNYT